MSVFNRCDDEYYDTEHDSQDPDRSMFYDEDERAAEEEKDSNMFSRGRKQSILEWLCAPTWTGSLDD